MGLTSYLASLDTRVTKERATEHEFLQMAAKSELSPALLSLWLSQDRIYAAHAYPRFIGALIAKIPFSSADTIGSAVEEKNQKILKALTDSLVNVVREASFFHNIAQHHGFNLDQWPERQGTRNYTAEMARVASLGSLQEGLVFLWAMEKASQTSF